MVQHDCISFGWQFTELLERIRQKNGLIQEFLILGIADCGFRILAGLYMLIKLKGFAFSGSCLQTKVAIFFFVFSPTF